MVCFPAAVQLNNDGKEWQTHLLLRLPGFKISGNQLSDTPRCKHATAVAILP